MEEYLDEICDLKERIKFLELEVERLGSGDDGKYRGPCRSPEELEKVLVDNLDSANYMNKESRINVLRAFYEELMEEIYDEENKKKFRDMAERMIGA